jgi:hypothetical protein
VNPRGADFATKLCDKGFFVSLAQRKTHPSIQCKFSDVKRRYVCSCLPPVVRNGYAPQHEHQSETLVNMPSSYPRLILAVGIPKSAACCFQTAVE